MGRCPQGGQLLWVAPSGGRDRPNRDGVWMPAPFDAASVELMRQMLSQARARSALHAPSPCPSSLSWGDFDGSRDGYIQQRGTPHTSRPRN